MIDPLTGEDPTAIPEPRTFIVTLSGGEKAPLVVQAHAYMIEAEGILSFILFSVIEAQGRAGVVPQKIRSLRGGWEEVHEESAIAGLASRLLN